MDSRRIGSLDVSVLGLGCNNFGSGNHFARIGENIARDVILAALDGGVRFFETARTYGGERSEVFTGAALRARRDEVVIATKVGKPGPTERGGAGPAYVKAAAERSLAALGVDVIDLLQLHAPDSATPIGDTLAAMGELVTAGKVREIGCSNFSAAQLREAHAAAADGAPRFASVQNEYSLLNREAEHEVLPECRRLGIAFIPYYPLYNGMLTGKYRRGEAPPAGSRLEFDVTRRHQLYEDDTFDRIDALAAYAAARGRTPVELAFAWLLAEPAVATVICGATSPDQARANATASTWSLAPEEAAEVDALAPRSRP